MKSNTTNLLQYILSSELPLISGGVFLPKKSICVECEEFYHNRDKFPLSVLNPYIEMICHDKIDGFSNKVTLP